MGGRGGASGFQNWQNRIPQLDEYRRLLKKDWPELEGSEKQIKWAKAIREDLRNDLWGYASLRTSDGRPTDAYNILLRSGRDGAIRDIKKLIERLRDSSDEVKKERLERKIWAYTDLAKRIKKYNDIFSNRSAAFWIENRWNSPKNYMNQKLKKYIDED